MSNVVCEFQAAAKGQLEEFQRHVENDSSRLCMKDSKGNTPLHKAAEFGRTNVIQFIIDKGGSKFSVISLWLFNTPRVWLKPRTGIQY